MKRAAVYITTFLFFFGLLVGLGQINAYAAPNPEYDINIHDTFPDEAFRRYISQNFDKNIDDDLQTPDGWLQPNELRDIKTIDVTSYKLPDGTMVESLEGIEYLTELTNLHFGSSVTRIGKMGVLLSNNTKLQSLHCNYANTQALLDLKKCEFPFLHFFFAENSERSFLDFSGAPKLQFIVVNNSDVVEIIANDCPSLVKIEANDCSELDWIEAKNSSVTNVSAKNSAVIGMDFENCSDLKQVNITQGNNAISQINLNGCVSLDWLYIKCLGLSYLNLSECPLLRDLWIEGDISTLDISTNTKLESLHAIGVNLDNITLGTHPVLTQLTLQDNNLKSLDISGCPALKYLDADGNNLSELDVSACPLLDNAVKTRSPDSYPGYYNGSEGGSFVVDEFVKVIYSGGVIDGSPIEVTPDVTLSAASYVYDGKVKKPDVKVEVNGAELDTSNYTVSYASGRKKVGTYKVTVKLKGNYSGTAVAAFKINPKGTSLSKLTPAKKALTVKWKNQTAKMSTARITGYQIQYSTKPDFSSGNITKTAKGYSKTSLKISKLKSGKKYYVRIRTYMKTGGKTYYSKWSKALFKKVK